MASLTKTWQDGIQQTSTTQRFVRYLPALISVLALGSILVTFVALDLSTYDASRPHAFSHADAAADRLDPGRLFAWLGLLAAVFVAYRCIYAVFPDALVTVAQDKTRGEMTGPQTWEAGLRILYDGSFLYVAAGLKEKIYATKERIPDGVFLALVVAFSFAYAAAFRISDKRRIEITASRYSPWMWIMVVFPAVAVVVLVVTYHLMTAARVSWDFFVLYTVVVGFVLGFTLLLWVWGVIKHVHHFWWALLCAHLCVFNTDAGVVAQSGFVGVYLHGISVFGPASIFE